MSISLPIGLMSDDGHCLVDDQILSLHAEVKPLKDNRNAVQLLNDGVNEMMSNVSRGGKNFFSYMFYLILTVPLSIAAFVMSIGIIDDGLILLQ